MTKDLENRFTYHKPTDAKVQIHEQVRSRHLALVAELSAQIPEGREKSLWLTKLEEATFWANAAVARHDAFGERM